MPSSSQVSLTWIKPLFYSVLLIADENIDETYGVNVQFEESEDEVNFFLACNFKDFFVISRKYQKYIHFY